MEVDRKQTKQSETELFTIQRVCVGVRVFKPLVGGRCDVQ